MGNVHRSVPLMLPSTRIHVVVHTYVENATEQVSSQSEGRREQHQELMVDLGKLKDKAKQVWDKMG